MRRAPRTVLSVALGVALALVAAAGGRAEIVAPGIHDGKLALASNGTPFVAYVRGGNVVIARRASNAGWQATRVGSVPTGSRVMDFKIGARGPVALVQSADDRTLVLVRHRAAGWQQIRLAGGLPAHVRLGWPGVALGGGGLPVVAYTRWNDVTWQSHLLLARVNARGRVRNEAITAQGFPQSYAAPPARPVFVRGRVHIVQSFGYQNIAGTIEWLPKGRTWSGLFLDAVREGDFPVGPLFAVATAPGRLYAAWSMAMFSFEATPVTLAVRGGETRAEFVLDRAITAALILPSSGPEIAANEWVGAEDLGLEGETRVWSATVVRGASRVGLDGSIAGFTATRRGGRDLLLSRPAGLSWFHAPARLTTRVSIDATPQEDGSVSISGRIGGVSSGRVTLYRERPGASRTRVGQASVTGGSFSFVDRPTARPLVYRAVYTDPKTGIPYAALSHTPVS